MIHIWLLAVCVYEMQSISWSNSIVGLHTKLTFSGVLWLGGRLDFTPLGISDLFSHWTCALFRNVSKNNLFYVARLKCDGSGFARHVLCFKKAAFCKFLKSINFLSFAYSKRHSLSSRAFRKYMVLHIYLLVQTR